MPTKIDKIRKLRIQILKLLVPHKMKIYWKIIGWAWVSLMKIFPVRNILKFWKIEDKHFLFLFFVSVVRNIVLFHAVCAWSGLLSCDAGVCIHCNHRFLPKTEDMARIFGHSDRGISCRLSLHHTSKWTCIYFSKSSLIPQ